MGKNVMVSVLCTAYNHESFIRDAIEGMLKQETDFKYEVIIHDDASTDGTVDIIREYKKEYPDQIKLILQEKNQFQKQHSIYAEYLFPQVSGKYIAFCEGDDYWTDEKKLQKQVDFLETHTDYSMCMHNAVKLNYVTGERKLLNTFEKSGTYGQREQIMAGLGTDFPAFASYVIRRELIKNIPAFFFAQQVLDYPLRQYYANCGKVYYFEEPMSVYRVSTPQSYMKKTSDDEMFYNDYIVSMIKFFQNLDVYTNERYHDLIECKLISDYLGFCLSIGQKEGLKKAVEQGIDYLKVQECYKYLSVEFLNDEIYQISKNAKNLFIYGTSRLASICRKQLEYAGIEFKGFVVSDGQMKMDALEDKKVFYLSEVLECFETPYFLLAVQPVNTRAIETVLKQYGIENFCKPYELNAL